MASETQIAKLALQHVGDRYDISDLTEESVEAEQVNLIFDDTRDWLLRQHPWGFAKKFATPSALVGTVPNNYDFMYTYMTDAVRTGDRTIMGDLDTLARNTINSAWETDSNEGISDAPPDADWIQARA